MLLRAGASAAVLAATAIVANGASAANQTVTIGPGNTFNSNDVTVTQGETVTWNNDGGLHNVVFDDGSFTEPASPSTSLWTTSRMFTATGDFGYFCEQHGAPGVGMAGVVHVVAATTGGGGGDPGGGSTGGGGGDPGGGSTGGEGGSTTDPGDDGTTSKSPFKVTLQVSDSTPRAGRRVRVFGFVRPAADGAKVQIQRRGRKSRYKTIATTRLRDAGSARSLYGVRLRLSSDAVLRVRVAGTGDHSAGLSKTKKLDVRRRP